MTLSELEKYHKIVRVYRGDLLKGKKLINLFPTISQRGPDLNTLRKWEDDYKSRGIPYVVTERDNDVQNVLDRKSVV